MSFAKKCCINHCKLAKIELEVISTTVYFNLKFKLCVKLQLAYRRAIHVVITKTEEEVI